MVTQAPRATHYATKNKRAFAEAPRLDQPPFQSSKFLRGAPGSLASPLLLRASFEHFPRVSWVEETSAPDSNLPLGGTETAPD